MADKRAWMVACWWWAGALACVLGGVLGAATPAAAQTTTTGSIVRPSFLGESNLNGATVRIRSSAGRVFTGAASTTSFWSVSGAPSGATISVSSVSATLNTRIADVTFTFTGAFTEDFTLTLQADFSVFGSGNAPERYTIPVRTSRLVVDTDLVAMGAQATALSVSEGGTVLFTVDLATQPSASATVTVSVSSGDATEGAVAPGSLEYSTTSWNTAQTVTVTGAEDFGQDGDQTWDVTVEVSGSNYGSAAAQTVRVTTTDEDMAGVVVDTDLVMMGAQATTLDVREDETQTAEYTLVLGTIPDAPVVVTVGDDPDTAVDDLTKVKATPGTLTFTAGTWNTAQTVTVEAEQDDDGAQDTVSLAHTVTSTDGNYAGRSVAAVAVRVQDDDDKGILPDTDPTTPTQDGGSLRVYEAPTHADHSVAYTVWLATQPVGGVVTVTVTPNDLTAVTVSPATVEFTASNWNTAQRVTVTAVDDLDMSGEVLELAHAAAGGDYGSTTTSVSVLVTDDDTPGLNVSVARLRIEEQADDSMATGRYTVRLNTAPAGSATVTVGIVQAVTNSDIVVSPSGTGALEFTASSWETAQDVTVTVTADDDAVDDTTTLAHTAAGSGDYASVAGVDVAVTVVDADEAGVEVTPRTLALTENHMTDGSAPYTVVLTTEPTEPVTLAITSGDGAAVSRAPGALTFTASDWATAQMVTATAAADDDAVDERVRVTHGLTGAAEYAAVRVPAVTVTVTDAEEQEIWIDGGNTPVTLSVNEDDSGTYTVALGSEPVNPVVVRISDDNADVQAMPGVVRFDASDWDTAQTVTVRADADADTVADTATLTHRAAGGDYTGVAEAVEVTVNVADDDGRLVISRPALTVLALQAATYTVRLGAQPAGPVTVTATSSTPAQATVGPAGSLGSRTLTFSPTTWATPQTVTVTGVAAGSPTVRHTAADNGGAYTITPARAAENVRVEVEGAGSVVLIEPRYLVFLEGTSQTYTIRPVTQPASDVTVGISTGATHAGNGANSSRNPFRHIFTPGDWNTAKTVTVSITSLSHTVPGSDRYTHTLRNFDNAGTVLTQRHRVVVEKIDDLSPTLAAVGAQTYRVGQRVNVRLPAGTGGNAPLSYTLTGPGAATDLTLPAGLTYTAVAQRIQGTPEVAAAEATYTLRVRDADGDAATRTFGLTVAARALPGFGAAALPAAPYALEEAVDVALPAPTVAQGTTPVLTFVLAPALPAGLRYEPPRANAMGAYETGGRIVGTPTEETPRRTYRLTVVDLAGNEAATEFALATGTPAAPPPSPPPPSPPPAVDLEPTFGTAAVAAQVYRQGAAIMPLGLPAATGGDGPLGYALTPALPAGLTYTAPGDATSGGTIAGVPAAAQAATTYTLTATDADGDAARLAFTIAVEVVTGEIRPQEGTQTVTLYGQAVTVTQAPGTLAGVTLTLPATLAQAVTIMLRPPGDEVSVARGRYGFGPAGAEAVVDIAVTPVPVDGLGICLPVPAELRAEAAGRAVVLLHYDGEQWAPVAGAQDAAAAGQVCAAGVRTFSPFAVGYRNSVPRFAEPVEDRTYLVNEASPPLRLPAATGGDGGVSYTLTPAELPAGLSYTAPTDATDGEIAGTPTAGHAATAYTLTATDADGDTDTVTFTLEVVRIPVQVTIGDAVAVEGAAVEFTVALSRAVARALTVQWTAGRPGSATPGEDYAAEGAGRLTLAAGTTVGTLAVRTVDDRRVEPPETFTVTVAVPDDPLLEGTEARATGRIEDNDTERARQRSLGMVLAGVGRTLATDAVDVIGDRFIRQAPGGNQVTVGGQALALGRDAQTGRWRQAAGVAYGVARALGVEVGAPVAGGAGQFGQVRGAAWSTLTRHLKDPHAAATPLSDWDTAGAFAAPTGPGWGGPPAADGGAFGQSGGHALAWERQAASLPFGRGTGPGVAGYGTGLGQGGFDRAHAATPQAVQAGRFRAPVQFRRVSGAEVLSQSQFEMPLSRTASGADPAAPGQPGETAAQAAAAAWTLWGRGTASGFDGKPKDDFSMDGNVFTGYLGLDYRLQSNVLLGLAVAHSQGDVDYEARDVTEGDVDLTLTSVLPYAHWSPRPGLGVWGLFGAGWGDLDLQDEAGKVKTDLEMLMGAVGARQEVLTWRQIDVAVKADAFLTELEAGADARLPKTAGDAQRLRLMVEGRTAWAMSEDSHLTPIFEIGGRWDGGKAETGVGAELGGGVEYAHTKLGLGIEARGRYLLAHQKSAFDEWGANLTLKLDPGADKRGLWLALAPVWGADASQVEQMWGSAEVLRAQTDTDATPGLAPEQVEFDVGYGVVTHEGAGLLTTYGGLSMAGPDRHGYRVGGRIELGEWVDLSVEGERTTRSGGAEHQVALYGHLGW